MKKFATALALILSLLILCSCGASSSAGEVVYSDENAVVISASETSGTLYDLLSELQDSGSLSFSGTDGDYGFFIESVNSRSADASKNEYWAVYTTLSELDGVSYSSSDFGTYDYDGTALASASYGVSGLPAVEGELYALVLSSY